MTESRAMLAWAKIKRDQAFQADYMASVASGIGEYAIANACYRLSAILAQQAQEIEDDKGPGGIGD